MNGCRIRRSTRRSRQARTSSGEAPIGCHSRTGGVVGGGRQVAGGREDVPQVAGGDLDPPDQGAHHGSGDRVPDQRVAPLAERVGRVHGEAALQRPCERGELGVDAFDQVAELLDLVLVVAADGRGDALQRLAVLLEGQPRLAAALTTAV
ncbi:hypothetical protein LUX33_10670 [Actinomadura madurae]|nr:hypothetical protein [Actinomadura madurae]MCP9948825.1 hypothetical protein [Actinomadura madurae]